MLSVPAVSGHSVSDLTFSSVFALKSWHNSALSPWLKFALNIWFKYAFTDIT